MAPLTSETRPSAAALRSQTAPSAPDRVGLLLRGTARSDTDAFDCLYDEVSGPVLELTTRVLRNRAIAEGVTHDVLIDVWRNATRYTVERGSGRAWILTIAHRRAFDRVRQERSAAASERTYALRDFVPPFDSTAESVGVVAERERLRNLVSGLSDVQREALCLAHYGGYTYAEVARMRGAPLGTVKTRIRDAITRVRAMLADEDGGAQSSSALNVGRRMEAS